MLLFAIVILMKKLFCLYLLFLCWLCLQLAWPYGAHAQDPFVQDPFMDFNEFGTGKEEARDVEFFQNSRFVSIALVGGTRLLLGELHRLQNPTDIGLGHAVLLGLSLDYFLSRNTALQLQFSTSPHQMLIQKAGDQFPGRASYTHLGGGLKFYINAQKLTKTVSLLNPYAFVGASQLWRNFKLNVSDEDDGLSIKQGSWSLNVGAGLEALLGKGGIFIGIGALYHWDFLPKSTRYQSGLLSLKAQVFSVFGSLGKSF